MLRKIHVDGGKDQKFSWWDLAGSIVYLIGDKKKKYLTLLAFLFIVNFYSIIPPFILGKIVDFFTNFKSGDSLGTFYFYAIFLGGSFSLVSFIRLNLKKTLGNINSDINYLTRVKGFERLVNLSLIETRNETAGEKATKIQNGTRAFGTLAHITNNEVFQSITSVIGIFIIFLFLKANYIIFIIIYILGFFAIVKYFYSKIQRLNYEYNISMEKSGGSYVEGLSNILTIKSLGAKKSFRSHIALKESVRKAYEYKIRKYGNGQWQVFQVFNGICTATFLYLIGTDIVTGAITLGSIVIFYGYLQRLTGSAGDMLSTYEELIEAKTGIARMMPIFLSDHKTDKGNKSFPQTWKEIRITNAGFDYKKEDKLKGKTGVKNINLAIRNGEKIGIVGKSGSGKSTLAKLLIGLYQFDSGTYKIDNISFYNIRETSTLKHEALVLQETEMFNLSIKDNVTLLKRIRPDLFEKAVHISQLRTVINDLPQNMDTLIGEKGYHLSGGERQRVGIARAIYKDPQILIFDEATSSLDSKTERLIYSGLENELKNKTTIIIAHRVTTLENVDKIYVMEQGKIVEEGKYQDLVTDPRSNFYRIYISQRKETVHI